MTIRRVVDGKELVFELSDDELFKAYLEQEHLFDVDSVIGWFDSHDEPDIMEQFCMSRTEIEAEFDDIAYEMRRQMDKYGVSQEYALKEAICDFSCRQDFR